MKLVTAIIQPDNLDAVREELIGAGISRITASRCTGRGNAEAVDLYRGQQVAPGLIPKVRLEIAVNQEFVQIAIDAIVKGARTGAVGDGKIFVTTLDEVVRIRTGETGSDAI
ncbi:MAG TPA: transcriptional regulator [Lentisphaeria bacterium]|nr:transcriptional regulator [Lentisphaeria bacterium]